MRTILQIGMIAFVVATYMTAATMYASTVQAAKPTQNWCTHTDTGNKDLCGPTKADCNTSRDASLSIYPDLTKCKQVKV